MLGLLLLPFLAAGAAAPAGAESDPYRHGVGSPYYGGSPYGGYGYGGGPYYGSYDPGDYGRAYYGQGYGWGGDGLPGGDWRHSCRDIVVRGDKLYAECRDFGGGWERTGITYTLCRGGMVNRRGSLECAGGGYYYGASQGYYDEVPEGSFRASCREERVRDGHILTARCLDWNGSYQRTGIDLRACGRGDIKNRGGELVCRGQSGAW
jgi:hypothetical protein